METSEKYMKRCIELARLGAGSVAPNPMVGCVIVQRGLIIGESFHQQYGQAHAEVNAVNAVKKPDLLKDSTLYVSLEPCAHQGLTPPCSDLIVEKQIPRVVIGTIDPFSQVSGKGIEKLRKAGIEVEVGILETECRELNKRFFTFHEKKRPYIILKWAQTLDGFIDKERGQENSGEPNWITGGLALRLVHKTRAAEGAILVGTNTAENDNPSLNVRNWAGENPVRAAIDRNLRLSPALRLFDHSSKTLVFNALKNESNNNTEWIKIDFNREPVRQIIDAFFQRKILSVIVEGGKQLLESFIGLNLWDEAHVFTGHKWFKRGIPAPKIDGFLAESEFLDRDSLLVFENKS